MSVSVVGSIAVSIAFGVAAPVDGAGLMSVVLVMSE